MSNTVLAAQTAAATPEFTVTWNKPKTVSALGLSGAEVVTVEHLRGDTYTPATDYTDASTIELTATSSMALVRAPGTYRLNKPITASATSLHVDGY